jgi:hypothetical protein
MLLGFSIGGSLKEKIMADDSNKTPDAEAPKAGDATAKAAIDPKLLNAHLASEVRATSDAEKAFNIAKEAAGTDQAKLDAAKKAFTEATGAVRKDVLGNIKDTAHQAEYIAHAEKNSAAFNAALPNVGKATNALGHLADHSGKYALAGAALLAAGAVLPGKETEKADGGTEKKSGLFKKAMVAIGALIAIGATMNKLGPTKDWVGKIAGERLAQAAKGAGASVGS